MAPPWPRRSSRTAAPATRSRTAREVERLGAAIAVLLAVRNPHRFAGVATVCGGYDPNGIFNAVLDMNFAVKTLLAPKQDIELVHVTDPARSTEALVGAVEQALTTPQGRARLALVGAFNNVTGWYSAHQPKPTDMTEWIRQQAAWIKNAYIVGLGPSARVDLERRAGGNPSSNVGIDYGRQLARSSQSALVRRAYRAAGLDLRDDLGRLAAAPRIAAVVTLHSTVTAGPSRTRSSGTPSRSTAPATRAGCASCTSTGCTARSAPPRRSSLCARCSSGSTPAGGRRRAEDG
jgi:hypothetical protein